MRKGIFERAYLNWHYRKDILMKDISERAFPKGHFDEGHFEGRAFPKGERAKGMKGIVHKLEFPQKKNVERPSLHEQFEYLPLVLLNSCHFCYRTSDCFLRRL